MNMICKIRGHDESFFRGRTYSEKHPLQDICKRCKQPLEIGCYKEGKDLVLYSKELNPIDFKGIDYFDRGD